LESILVALTEQQEELGALLTTLTEEQWALPTRCEGWTVADVVLHLAQTNELALASAQGRFAEELVAKTDGIGARDTVDDGAAGMVEHERGEPGASVRDRWAQGVVALRDQLSTADPHQRVMWVAGRLSVRTLATTRLAETWIHTGDVADALDVELPPAPRLQHIARLAWRTLPYAFARAGRSLTGPVRFDLVGPDGEPWHFAPDGEALTTISGDGVELCSVAARRVEPGATRLHGQGPDAVAVLELVRTYA
jgi:uncharacterized protein (TIGR03084 family)